MTRWWDKPQLRRDEDEGNERKVGFLDLFYDLIFVVAVAQLAHDLAHHPDLVHAGRFALLFAAVWWLWIGNTFYVDRFETLDVSHRVFTFLQMMPVVGLAVFAQGAFADTRLEFAVAYCMGRSLLIYLWWRGGHHDQAARPATDGYVTGFSLGLVPWIVSFFVPHPLAAWLWLLGLLIDLSVPSLLVKRLHLLPKFSHSRLAERFGLFTIIVLGESVAGTVNGLGALEDVTALGQLTALLAMILAFELWWIYFDMVPRERIKAGFWPVLGRSYLHYPLLGAIAASGAGVLSLVGHEGEVLGAGRRALLFGSLAIAFLAMFGLSRVHDYQPLFQGARFRTEACMVGGGLLFALLALWGPDLDAVPTLIVAVTITLVPIVWGAWHWAKVAGAMEPA